MDFIEFAYNGCSLGFGAGKRGKLMAEVNKILYVVVVEDEDDGGTRENGKGRIDSFRYTRAVLQSTLQLMGCKPRHAFKVFVLHHTCSCRFSSIDSLI